MKKFINLSNVLGKSFATSTTVHLFNSCQYLLKDKKGRFIYEAIKPHKSGVIVVKKYIKLISAQS